MTRRQAGATVGSGLCRVAVTLAIFAASGVVAVSAAPSASSSPDDLNLEPQPGGPSDPKEVGAFIDGLMAEQLPSSHVAGAMVVVVRDEQVLLSQGYGYADLEAQRPFDAARTRFPIGSTGKLFMWTAVMQLMERGKLDLEADVNDYLQELRIPDTYPQPVTLKDLMSHTAGFEERNMGTMAFSPAELISVEQSLIQYRPQRVRPPGQITAYSNYGATLAGYIVEIVSGIPFEQYIEENIYGPLEMSRSSFRQPLSAEEAVHLSAGYAYKDDFVRQSLTYVSMRPAGSMSTTADDIAHFIIAHLEEGRYENVRILQRETARLMHSRLFANEPRLSGLTYGFMDQQINGQRVLHHGGGLPPYYGILALLPETGVGFYVGYNGLGDPPVVTEFRDRFFDHYYPRQAESAPAVSTGATPPESLAGTYRTTRSNLTSLESIINLSGAGYGSVRANPDGSLEVSINMGSSRLPNPFVEVEPLLFVSTDGREKIAFRKDPGGGTWMMLDMLPWCAFERIAWYEQPGLHVAVLALCMVVFGATIAVGIGGWLLKRRSRATGHIPEADRARRAALALSAVGILTIGGSVGVIFKPLPWVAAVLALAWLAAALSVLVVVFAIRAWHEGYWRLAGRLHYTTVALAAVLFTLWMARWNFLKFGW
jgi:CubicO group peptidase (beta-lactamase class C family)